MPYKSEKQRKYLHAAKPEVARKFDKDIKRGKGAQKRASKKGKK